MLAIRQAGDQPVDIYKDEFLIERPMLAALRSPEEAVLLIDEIDRSDHEFEAFLLEFLSDFSISIPERGTLRAHERPVVVLTSNRTRELHEALRRRCVYHWIDYPTPDREARIVMMRASSVAEAHGARRRRGGRAAAARAADQAAGCRRGGRLGRGRDAVAPARRALAGRLQARDRRRAQGRGGPHLRVGPARPDHRGGGGVSALPRAAQPFVTFPALLRANGFAVAPEQTATFLEAVGLLGPRSIADIRRAAHATLAPPPDRRAAFDALFGMHFLGEMEEGEALGEPEDETVRVQEERAGGAEPLVSDEVNEAGQDATAAEALSVRRFGPASDYEVLRRFARAAPAHLPRRPGYRRMRARRGEYFDTRRTLREAVRNDGDVMTLRRLKRRLRQRRILLLIDVSGSMKERTEQHLRIAHALAHAVERIEVFTFGTRLTRVTRAMRLKNRDMALAATSSIVSDWDGGTRIGEALQAFLAVPRFAGYSRGAVVLILSDGLERGDPAAMREAVTRLSRLAWRVSWLTPLAADPNFTPQTEGLKAILPLVDDLADGSSVAAVCAHVLDLESKRAA